MTPQQPTPPFIGSIALVRRFVNDAEQWLGVENTDGGVFELPQAARGKAETFRSCLDEALETTLGLRRQADYLISGLARAHYQAPVEWPGEIHPQWVIVEFFAVDLYGKKAAGIIDALSKVRWLSALELEKGSTTDRVPICTRQLQLMNAAHVLPIVNTAF
ncbi:MAG: hypothetical protein KDA86_21270 [Planctomycetaceae bacterium]|nr:hypothetical protein [Planctomycetaceae bacterium]